MFFFYLILKYSAIKIKNTAKSCWHRYKSHYILQRQWESAVFIPKKVSLYYSNLYLKTLEEWPLEGNGFYFAIEKYDMKVKCHKDIWGDHIYFAAISIWNGFFQRSGKIMSPISVIFFRKKILEKSNKALQNDELAT